MDGLVRILRRFVGSTILVSVVLLLFNLVLLGSLIFKEIHQGPSPGDVVKQVAGTLSESEQGEYILHSKGMEILDDHQAWAMLLDQEGRVQWSERLPSEIPLSYSVTDVAKFSRYYLKEYPVYVWERQDGLLVLGYPKNSYGKYQFDFLAAWLKSLPVRIVLLLICNVALALLISLLIGTRVIRSIRPLINGIHALAKGESVQVETKGIFNDLSESINSTSHMLQEKTDALKARDEARSNWISGISHDIRTPLSMILGYASELEEQPDLTTEQKQQASIIRRQGERLRSLVSDLNLVSMLEYEMQPMQMKSIRLSVLARQVVSDFLNNGLDERYPISLNVEDESLYVQGDERLLYRAVTNLVQNSIRHNPDGCTIELMIKRDGQGTDGEFIVSDDGKGIPEEDLQDVLILPYTAGRLRPPRHGHGLGLPMVSRIAQAHRGKLLLQHNSEGGLRAVVQLPVVL
ncbi:Adaptive-response sensory-kinase SasA [Paenibacillus sp. JJ-100]|uniref:sensor histidine kinase n=1 Tax=Paenibacillus sp. JJ-100 TaxID=2974896 RepID=UPI0022FF8C11|nr:HAMP domain-containing sensor histidine kinase [Paenibacillus sp. JJ-100]CAI6083715.1 Adaptive-response sensory-kinase SasA [Paenibacillus sp. JJ-100]